MRALQGRAPHGARGLKHEYAHPLDGESGSRPARGAWIETKTEGSVGRMLQSRPARGAWIETSGSA